MVELLLLSGADVTKRNKARVMPLHEACVSGVRSIVEALIGAGADVNAADTFGLLPLHCAGRHGRTVAARLLLEAGADCTARDELGLMPRELAKQRARHLRRRDPELSGRCVEVARILKEETPELTAAARLMAVSANQLLCTLARH